jgi:YesN/AraC family two-component response regulator
MPRILIVDDHQAARTTLRELLDWHSFQVCGDAKDGKEAIEKVVELKPEIVLMDINMPVLNGIATAQEIRRIAPSTKIVFLTVHDTPVFKAGMKLWGHGFVSKSAAGTDLIPTLERIAGLTANEMTVECPHCKVRQNIHVGLRSGVAKKEHHQYISCVNCRAEFDVKVPDKIVGGPFIA